MSVKFTPGIGVMPTVWKSPGIVKLVLLPNVWGFSRSPLRLVEEVPALRSRSLVVDIWVIMIDVALKNTSDGGDCSRWKCGDSWLEGWYLQLFALSVAVV